MFSKGVISNVHSFQRDTEKDEMSNSGFVILVYHDHMESANAYHKETISGNVIS